MSDEEKKPEKKAEEKESPQTIIYKIEGDLIQGDKTSIDSVKADAVAVGRDSSASVEGASGSSAPAQGARPGGGQELDHRHVYGFIVEKFSLSEIKELCFELDDVEYDDLPGDTRKAKARELVDYMRRRGRLGELDAIVRGLRGE